MIGLDFCVDAAFLMVQCEHAAKRVAKVGDLRGAIAMLVLRMESLEEFATEGSKAFADLMTWRDVKANPVIDYMAENMSAPRRIVQLAKLQ